MIIYTVAKVTFTQYSKYTGKLHSFAGLSQEK